MSVNGYKRTQQIHLSGVRSTPESGHSDQLFGTILADAPHSPMFLELREEWVDLEGAQDLDCETNPVRDA